MLLPSVSDPSLRRGPGFESRIEANPPLWLEGGLALLNRAGEMVEINSALADWLGEQPEEMAGRPLGSILAARCATWDEAWAALDEGRQTFAHAEWFLPAVSVEPAQWFKVELTRYTEGKVFRISSQLPPSPDVHEQGCQQCLSTVPARREMFFRLLRAEEQLGQLMQRWPGVVFSQRPDGSFYFISPRIEELTGIPAGDWEKQPGLFEAVVHEADLKQVTEGLQQASRSTQPLTSMFRVRHTRTGKLAYVLEHRQAITTSKGLLLGYEGVWLDQTRQTMVEKRLSAASWKETMSALTMGLAHDFRNTLAGIVALTDTMRSQLEPEHPFQPVLESMRSNAWQTSQSIQRILQLYRGKSGERCYADLNELAQEMTGMTQKMLSRRIAIELHLAEGRLPIYADAFEFRQAFLNLAVNACDAMPEGGRIQVTTSRHDTFPEFKLVQGNLPRLPAVCLTVTDTGSGIPEEHLSQIFDPFFTTKGFEKGSGLGLYNVMLFAEGHRGAVSVDSQQGQGATFRLWLPEADFTEMENGVAGQPSYALLLFGPGGQALESMADFLRQHGFGVVICTQAETALDLLRTRQPKFACVLMQTTAKCPGFFADIKGEKLPVKTILQVIGCNQDELDSAFLSNADLVLSPETVGHLIPSKIRSLLPGTG